MQEEPEVQQPESIDFSAHEVAIKEYLEAKGLAVKPVTEFEAERRQVEQLAASSASKKAYGEWESALEAVIGEKKPDGVKGTDWLKQKAESLKKPAVTEQPEPAKPSNVADDVAKKLYQDTQKELNDLKAQIAAEKESGYKKAVTNGLRTSLKALNISGDTPEEKASKVQALETLLGRYEVKFDENDDLVFYENGEPITDSETMTAIKVDKLVKSKFGYFLAPEKKEERPAPTGTGTQQGQLLSTPEGKKGIMAKNEDEIREAALAKGYAMGSPQFKEFKEASMKISGLA